MRNVFTVVLLLIEVFCVGGQSNRAEMMEDMKTTLSTLETYHRALQDSLGDEQHVQKRAVKNVLEFCEELNSIVDRQIEVLKNLKQSLHDNLCPGPKEAWPCFEGNYTAISDSGRSSEFLADVENRDLCDIDLQPGWYRFYLHGENAVMPTSCVPEFHCKTEFPSGWIYRINLYRLWGRKLKHTHALTGPKIAVCLNTQYLYATVATSSSTNWNRSNLVPSLIAPKPKLKSETVVL